jgi:hypothetical protein
MVLTPKGGSKNKSVFGDSPSDKDDFGNDYKSEDELEDMLSQVDTHSVYTEGSAIEAMVVKFSVHKKLKELLEQDLSCKVQAKSKKGLNTFFFGSRGPSS